jgi:pyruvate dehydrogenase E2 component (dihydrolipoamide acetyltransferase)
VARRLAEERGIDLSILKGSGPEGQITKEDVERASSLASASSQTAQPQSLTTMQRLIAERTLKSVREVPHFFVTVDVEMGKAQQRRKQLGVSLTALLIKAAALALRDFPDVNARFMGNRIERIPSINIGVIVATPDGMLIPVIRDADKKSLAQIASEERDLAERGRRGALTPQELSGGTFTISNLGMYGVDQFTAIIYPPESAILAVGRVADQVVAREGQVVIRPMMSMTLSSDHRVIYGTVAGQFLGRLKQLLEAPDLLEKG